MTVTDTITGDEFLELLGRKVRALRAGRGMTRKMLTADSGVSERYLAQLELGKGNIAVGLMVMGIFIGVGISLGLVIGLGLS